MLVKIQIKRIRLNQLSLDLLNGLDRIGYDWIRIRLEGLSAWIGLTEFTLMCI